MLGTSENTEYGQLRIIESYDTKQRWRTWHDYLTDGVKLPCYKTKWHKRTMPQSIMTPDNYDASITMKNIWYGTLSLLTRLTSHVTIVNYPAKVITQLLSSLSRLYSLMPKCSDHAQWMHTATKIFTLRHNITTKQSARQTEACHPHHSDGNTNSQMFTRNSDSDGTDSQNSWIIMNIVIKSLWT